jgi:hypothetical protein
MRHFNICFKKCKFCKGFSAPNSATAISIKNKFHIINLILRDVDLNIIKSIFIKEQHFKSSVFCAGGLAV